MTPIARRGLWALGAVGVGLLAAINIYLAARSIFIVVGGSPAVDWDQIVEAGGRVHHGDLYAVNATYAFPYSPLLAYVAGPLSWLGTVGWRVLHVAAALALPKWPMRLATLAAWPFWFDLETGNVLVFVVLTAAWAIRGNRWATAGYFLLTLLVPRPLTIPVAVWLLWRRPEWRLRFAVMAVAALAGVVASGWADEWLGFVTSIGGQFESPNNLGPTRLIGAAWLLIGIPLAGWLIWRGRLGLASVALSYPYLLPYYLLMLILELAPRSDLDQSTSARRDRCVPAAASTGNGRGAAAEEGVQRSRSSSAEPRCRHARRRGRG